MDKDVLVNDTTVADVCLLMVQVGEHELVDENMVVLVVLESDRSQYLRNDIYTVMPSLALKIADLILMDMLAMVDTLRGENDHVTSASAMTAKLYMNDP